MSTPYRAPSRPSDQLQRALRDRVWLLVGGEVRGVRNDLDRQVVGVVRTGSPCPASRRACADRPPSLVLNLGLRETTRYVGAIRSVGRKGKRAVRAYPGTRVDDLDKVIASGSVVTANCTVDGQPAAVIATLDRKTQNVLDCRIYTDLIG